MSVDAYRKHMAALETERQADARKLSACNHLLIAAKENPQDAVQRRQAILATQELWQHYALRAANLAASPQSPINEAVRDTILRLAMNMSEATSRAVLDIAYLDVMIDANKALLQGIMATKPTQP